jgi:hypothetical protein
MPRPDHVWFFFIFTVVLSLALAMSTRPSPHGKSSRAQ